MLGTVWSYIPLRKWKSCEDKLCLASCIGNDFRNSVHWAVCWTMRGRGGEDWREGLVDTLESSHTLGSAPWHSYQTRDTAFRNSQNGFSFLSHKSYLVLPKCQVMQWWRTHLPMQEMQETWVIYGSGRSPGVGNGNPLQYYCLENSMDRGAWRVTVHGVSKSRTRWSTQSPWA